MQHCRSYPPLFILRHGETEWNRQGRTQGRLDSPLTARGRAQAERQGATLRALSLPPDIALWSSPQGRARATAIIALDGLAENVPVDDRLREVSVGLCEGLTNAEIEARFPGLIDPERPFEWYFDCPGGEALSALQTRVKDFLAGLSGPSVLVTHSITSRVLRAEVLGCDWRSLDGADGAQGVVYELRDGQQDRHAGD